MPSNVIDPYKVQEIRALKGYANHNEAQKLLESIAEQVQPLMRVHKLKVPLLLEFLPKNPCLLGVNFGSTASTIKISLRLRRNSEPSRFLDFGSILGTMLHELCHDTHRNHSDAFYCLLSKYRTEMEDMMAKGLKGSAKGFDAPAAGRVGGRWRNPSAHDSRIAALQAAEKRAALQRKNSLLAPAGPHTLGRNPGRNAMPNMTPAQAAAWAAEQRARDQEACGNDDVHGANVGYDDQTREIIYLDDSDDEIPGHQQQRSASGSDKSKVRAASSDLPTESSRASDLRNANRAGPSSRQPSSRQSSSGNELPNRAALTRKRDPNALNADRLNDVIDLTSDEAVFICPPVRKRIAKPARDQIWEWSCGSCTMLNAPWLSCCEICGQKRL